MLSSAQPLQSQSQRREPESWCNGWSRAATALAEGGELVSTPALIHPATHTTNHKIAPSHAGSRVHHAISGVGVGGGGVSYGQV